MSQMIRATTVYNGYYVLMVSSRRASRFGTARVTPRPLYDNLEFYSLSDQWKLKVMCAIANTKLISEG